MFLAVGFGKSVRNYKKKGILKQVCMPKTGNRYWNPACRVN